ncbi:hypothetical protein EG329_012340 [Mollisiaceae sp. DMI_Dod_QoI]|nr:hypothetical protein EG329_012340 [Helotiales sp. DMI_Dod_QoI]
MAIELSHLYQRLPTELQLKIWEHTLEPRCIKICGEDLVDRLPRYHKDGAPPLALQVCQILRAHFLPRYPKLFEGEHVSTPIVRPHVRINSALDTVVIYALWPSTVMSLSRWSGGSDLSRIRHLAVPSLLWQTAILSYSYPDWRKAMANFTHLETLTIVTDQIMQKRVAVDLLEEAIKNCLLSVKAENEGWTVPRAKVICIDDFFSRECDLKTQILHIKIDFCLSELEQHLKGKDAVICIFNGSDIHLSSLVLDAATATGIKLFIPCEFGLDTANSKIRDLLPPYQARFQFQQQLRNSGIRWKAIYSGTMLEDALKTDGVLGIDVLWGSVVVFPGAENLKVAVSTYDDVARTIVEVLRNPEASSENELYSSTFIASLDELAEVVELTLDKKLDRYEGNFDGARMEAAERMKRGYFDGGVALMRRVAVWDPEVSGWDKWQKNRSSLNWEQKIRGVVRLIRNGEIGGDGCGC